MKSVSCAFLIAIIVCGFSLAGTIHFGTVHASTEVTGIISSDTAWTLENSPYSLTGNVLVNNGVTLTINAGTVLNLGSYYIMVNGTLQALGNQTTPITFNDGQIIFTQYSVDWNESMNTGCIIQNGILVSSLEINNSPKLCDSTAYNEIMIETLTGIPLIINNIIKGGMVVVGNGNVTHNEISGQGIDVFGSNLVISNNIISNCQTGILVSTSNYSPSWHWVDPITLIEKNLIINNTNGISLNAWQMFTPCAPIIRNNTILNNENGIYLTYLFSYNEPTLIYNNIYANLNYNINNQVPANNINATYNWWGTTDTQAINQTIYDFNNDFYLGTVNFIPFLTELNSEAPEIPEPEPEQTPTLPTYISISVDASSTVVGSAVNVNGRLTDVNGSALPDKLVTLLYSIAGNDWVPIGSGTTNDTGDYNIQWVNTASGTFTLKVEWIGNDDYLGASANTTLSFLPQQNQKIFFVESNSTVSALTFNSTNTELSFTVSGASGTTGYVKATIPKDLLYTEGDWSVLVDEQPVIPTVNEDANNTYLYFTYGHSTKTVEIIGTTAILEFPSWTPLLIMLVAVIAVAVIYRSILNKPNEGRKG